MVGNLLQHGCKEIKNRFKAYSEPLLLYGAEIMVEFWNYPIPKRKQRPIKMAWVQCTLDFTAFTRSKVYRLNCDFHPAKSVYSNRLYPFFSWICYSFWSHLLFFPVYLTHNNVAHQRLVIQLPFKMIPTKKKMVMTISKWFAIRRMSAIFVIEHKNT